MRIHKYKLWDVLKGNWYDYGDIYLDEYGQLYRIEELGQYERYMNKENVTARYELVMFTGLKDKNEVDLYEQDVIDENGVKAGNTYESYYLNPTTYLIIAGLGTKKWSSTEQEAIKRGCFYAE